MSDREQNQIHRSCARAYDGDIVGPACDYCKDRIGRMDYLSGAGDR